MLVGFPVKEYKIRGKKGDKIVEKWVAEKAVDYHLKKGWGLTDENRMGYAKPEWIVGKDNKPGILLLDDYSRANPAFLQATMQLVQHGEYISWKLPDNWVVILTTNPDDGNHSVSSMDEAQKSRFVSVSMKYSEKKWAAWAENNSIDSRAINFLLLYPEAVVTVDENSQEKIVVNPRRWVQFFNLLSGFDDLNQNLPMVKLLGDASVGQMASNLFVTFINNNLDKLISPEKMLLGDTDVVVNTLKQLIGEGEKYRADIASTLGTRFINFTLNYSRNNSITNELTTHIETLFDKQVFGADINYNIIYQLFAKNKQKFTKLLVKPAIIKALS